jgi:hypothetical protein
LSALSHDAKCPWSSIITQPFQPEQGGEILIERRALSCVRAGLLAVLPFDALVMPAISVATAAATARSLRVVAFFKGVRRS